jgi:hypothetical protein
MVNKLDRQRDNSRIGSVMLNNFFELGMYISGMFLKVRKFCECIMQQICLKINRPVVCMLTS